MWSDDYQVRVVVVVHCNVLSRYLPTRPEEDSEGHRRTAGSLDVPSNHPWNRILPEKLIVAQFVKNFTVFYGTGSLVIVFERSHHWSLSWNW